jgi:raffinose/stachyose/melibiose transport system permease protein
MGPRFKVRGILIFLLLAILTVTFLYPLYFMAINSLKTRTDYFTNQFNLPAAPLQFVNYTTMISQFKILNLFKNSFIVSAMTVVGLLMIGTSSRARP